MHLIGFTHHWCFSNCSMPNIQCFQGSVRLKMTISQVPGAEPIRCPQHAYMSNVQTATHNTS
jgi:hypothetical protein